MNQELIVERNQELKELLNEMEMLNVSWSSVSELINYQGSVLDIANKNMEESKENSEQSKISLERSVNYVQNRLILVRDVSIVVGSTVLGLGGFIFGPIFGVGTLVAGVAGGSAAVATLHKTENK